MCVAEFNAGRGTRCYSCNNIERERERERERDRRNRAVEKEEVNQALDLYKP